ncbi:MAG: tripartite tricarboxylate transporter TctB family protein [Candidatus Binatia bacterium]
MGFQPSMLFTLCVVVVAAYAVFTAKGWPPGTGMFPRFVGIPVLVLALIQLIFEAYRSLRPGEARNADTGDLQVDWSMGTGMVTRRALCFFGWLLGLFFGIWLFGFFIAIPLFAFLYLRLQAKEGWLLSSGLTLGVLVFFVGLFDQILHIHWLDPLLPWPEALLKSLLPWLG